MLKKTIALALSLCMVLTPLGVSADEIVFNDEQPIVEEQIVFDGDNASDDVSYVDDVADDVFTEDELISESFSDEDFASGEEAYAYEESSSYEESTDYALADVDFSDVQVTYDNPVANDTPVADDSVINEDSVIDENVVVSDDSALAETIDAATTAVQKKIDALKDPATETITTKDKVSADAAQTAYKALSKTQQANITDEAKAKLDAYADIKYVAQNKTKGKDYISLKEAVEDAKSGNTIVALRDITETNAIKVSIPLTIDGDDNENSVFHCFVLPSFFLLTV